MRLMLKLLSLERTDADTGEFEYLACRPRPHAGLADDQNWFVPSTELPASITASIGALNQFLFSPPSLDEDPKNFLRPVRKRTRRARSASGSGSELDQPKKIRTKKAIETQVYKSAAFIVDSDDDDEADVVFFARERELRAEMEALAEKHGSAMLGTGTKKRKRRNKAKDKEGPNGQEEDMPALTEIGEDTEEKEMSEMDRAVSGQQDEPENTSESEDEWGSGRMNGKGRRTTSSLNNASDDGRPTQARSKSNGRSRIVESDEDD